MRKKDPTGKFEQSWRSGVKNQTSIMYFFVLTKLTNLLLFKCIKHISGRIDVTIGNSNARKNPTHGDFKSHGVFGNNPKKNPIRKSLLLKTPRRFLIELDSRVCVIVELDSPIIEIIGE